jgi:hypothetical protein
MLKLSCKYKWSLEILFTIVPGLCKGTNSLALFQQWLALCRPLQCCMISDILPWFMDTGELFWNIFLFCIDPGIWVLTSYLAQYHLYLATWHTLKNCKLALLCICLTNSLLMILLFTKWYSRPCEVSTLFLIMSSYWYHSLLYYQISARQ